jgi:hypothetical protein
MKKTEGWLIALAIAALLVAACGPEMVTPTPQAAAGASPTARATAAPVTTPQVTVQQTATIEPVDLAKLPVDPIDYRALGPADAAVKIIEYSDFQ